MTAGLDLDQYQLRSRILLVFAPAPGDARYEEQHAYLAADEDALEEMSVLVFGIFEHGPSFAEQRSVSHEDSVRERKHFGIEEGEFALALIDLDGTQILDSREPLPVDYLQDVVEDKEG